METGCPHNEILDVLFRAFARIRGKTCLSKGCKVIGILDNVVPHEQRFFDTPFTKYFLGGCDGFVTMCDAVTEDLLRLKPDARYIMRQHPLYSHFGEKLSRSKAEEALGLKPGMKNILFFGLIRQYKGLDILLEAFAGLDDSYQLIIVSEPYGSFEPYQKIIDSIPGKDRIHIFPKYIKDSEVKDYFSAADVTVLPYRSATQSGISSVSYHFEVPMIVTDVGGLKSTIGDTGTGIVAEKAEPDCIRKEIERYFAEPATRQDCIERIQKRETQTILVGILHRPENVCRKVVKTMMRTIIPAICTCVAIFGIISGTAEAQTYTPTPVTISKDKVKGSDGKVYWSHVVLEKQTLFSIAKAYGVKTDDILKANPNLDLGHEGLKKNSILLIPVVEAAAEAVKEEPEQKKA